MPEVYYSKQRTLGSENSLQWPGDHPVLDGPLIAYPEFVPLDWNSGALAEGIRCYRDCEFFLAHEHWESVWLRLEEPEKSFLQALIQTTAPSIT